MTPPAGRPKAARHIGDPRDALFEAVTERELTESVREFCKREQLLAYHTRNSQQSAEGWPDWAIVAGRLLVLAELKTMTGGLRPAQVRWQAALDRVDTLWTGTVRPDEWERLQRRLLRAKQEDR